MASAQTIGSLSGMVVGCTSLMIGRARAIGPLGGWGGLSCHRCLVFGWSVGLNWAVAMAVGAPSYMVRRCNLARRTLSGLTHAIWPDPRDVVRAMQSGLTNVMWSGPCNLARPTCRGPTMKSGPMNIVSSDPCNLARRRLCGPTHATWSDPCNMT